MMKKTVLASAIASLGLVLVTIGGKAVAQIPHNLDEMQNHSTEQFQRIEQPIINKIIVTLGGLGLIGLELWWFLPSKPKSAKAGIQKGNADVSSYQTRPSDR